MNTIRVICYSSENGALEGVFFTQDYEKDAEDVLPPNCTVDSDSSFDGSDFPISFPLEYNLERRI